jgi:dipeptidyl aminopeptidase/acylaminoacyl peptidase
LIVHGTADPTVPYAQSAAYVPALHAGGVHATLVTVPGAVHSFYIVGGSAPIQATCTTLAFLRHYLAP